MLFAGAHSGGNRVGVTLESSTGKVAVALRNSSNTVLWASKTSTDYTDGNWHHVGITWDLSATTAYLYVDGTADQVDSIGPTAGTVDYAGATEWLIGASIGGGANFFTGSLYDVAFWPNVFLDFTDEDSLQRIVADDSATDRLHTTPTGVKPVGYGREGRYMDFPAYVLFSGDFQRNLGVGGSFTPTGTFDEDSPATADSSPNPFRLFPRWRTDGERWFLSEQSGIPYPKGQTVVEQREGLTSFGKRIGLDEVDDRTRRERPGLNYSDLILGIDEDDDEDDYMR